MMSPSPRSTAWNGSAPTSACNGPSARQRRSIRGATGASPPSASRPPRPASSSSTSKTIRIRWSPAAFESEPVHFPVGPRQPETPLESTPFTVIPLRSGHSDRKPVGLLLIGTDQPTLDPDILWFAEVLGEKLTRLRSRTIQSDRGLDRERQLLYNIINAVTDPILLTDASGKLIIGNRHAELLFAARDDESEGRRRAVALNNMFFSSALASRAMDQTGTTARELVLVDPDDGSDLLFEFLTSPVKEFQEDSALVSVLRNVTDLGQARRELEENYRRLHIAEAAARAERNRLDLIVDSVVDPIIVSDPTGDILMTNAPAEKFFTVPPDSGVGPEAQRRVSANEAHFSSFVSSLLLSGADARWRGRVALADPATGRMVPVEAVAGKMMSDQAELTAVVTVFHDQTEAIEKERLYDELRRASDQLEAKVQAATAELEHQNKLLRQSGDRAGTGLGREVAVPGQHLARVPHAAQRHPRLHVDAAERRLRRRARHAPPHRLARRREQPSSAGVDQRHPRHLAHRGGPHAAAAVDVPDRRSGASGERGARRVIQRSPVAVEFVIAPRVPPIRSDRQKVKQILVNLLSNSLKFTHEGSIRVDDRATIARPARSPSKCATPASASPPPISSASSKTSSRWTARRRGRMAARDWASRSAAASRICWAAVSRWRARSVRDRPSF